MKDAGIYCRECEGSADVKDSRPDADTLAREAACVKCGRTLRLVYKRENGTWNLILRPATNADWKAQRYGQYGITPNEGEPS